MKKSILLFSISLFVNTFSFSQWEKIAEVEDNLEALYILNSMTTIAVGSNTKAYNLNSNTPSEPAFQLSNFGFITSLAYINENESYLGGGCYFPFDECPANTLHKTMDNGETWQEVITDITFNGTGNIFGIIPINETELILISDFNNINKVDISTGKATSLLIPGTEEANSFTLGKVSNSGKWLVAASFYDIVTQNTIIYYESNDSGITWEELELNLEENERVAFIDYLPSNDLAFVSSKGNVYTISDGNITPGNMISDVHDQISAQYVINNNDWYVASYDQESNESRLHLSIDGGQSWAVSKTFDEGLITDLSFVDRNNGFLIFNYNGVYKRTGPNNTKNVNPIEITISPNPVNNFIRIDLNTDVLLKSIEIIDAVGRKVKKFSAPKFQYDVSDLASGFYLVLISTNSGDVIAQESFIKR